MFGKENVRKTKATWESEHFVKATVSGEGVMKAVDAAGNDLAEYQVIKGRAAAGPFKAGDCFLFEVPAAKADMSPIRDAFRMANIERPDILLFADDGYHQSPYGSYLKSCVNYLVLFGEPFGDNPSDCGLDPKRTAALRTIAEAVVLGEKFGR